HPRSAHERGHLLHLHRQPPRVLRMGQERGPHHRRPLGGPELRASSEAGTVKPTNPGGDDVTQHDLVHISVAEETMVELRAVTEELHALRPLVVPLTERAYRVFQ